MFRDRLSPQGKRTASYFVVARPRYVGGEAIRNLFRYQVTGYGLHRDARNDAGVTYTLSLISNCTG